MKAGSVSDLFDILRDPSDTTRELRIDPNSNSLVGKQIKERSFNIVDGIPDLFCTDIEPPSHYPIGDADWDKWIGLQANVFSEFTYSGNVSGYIQELGHRVAVEHAPQKENSRVVEIGSGTSHHLLTYRKYYPPRVSYINVDTNLTTLKKARRLINEDESESDQISYFLRASIYHLPFASHSVNHVLAIYVFEHIKYLRDALDEYMRILSPGGTWCIVIPTEGGLAWTLGRKLMFSRQMRQRYGIDYDHIMKIEHCNTCNDVIRHMTRSMDCQVQFFPFRIPSSHINAVAVLYGKTG
jgi:ubiquinone/menaquinone biosynthesis C-methylase UbiE